MCAPLALFLSVALALTYPFAVKPTTTILGPMGGDVTTSIAKFAALEVSGTSPFSETRHAGMGWPTGVRTTPGVDRVSFLSTLFLWLGTKAVGSIAIHGILGVLGYTSTAMAAFLMVRRLTASPWAGIVAGTAFGFSPHLVLMAWAATTYTWMWLLALPLAAAWHYLGRPSRTRAFLLGGALLPAAFWTPYFLLHTAVVYGTSVVVAAILQGRSERSVRGATTLAWSFAPVVVAAVATLALGSGAVDEVPQRTRAEAYEQSAHPLMYVIPGYASIYGKETADLLTTAVPRAMFANLYVGVSVLLLAGVGAGTSLVRLRRTPVGERVNPTTGAGVLALSVVVVTFLCSLPPTVSIGSFEVPMLSNVIVTLQPAFRAGQRFVMPLIAGLALLAGLGAAQILARARSEGRWIVGAVMTAVVFIDLFTRPPHATITLPDMPALAELDAAPPGAVVQVLKGAGGTTILGEDPQYGCLLQDRHGRPVVNVCEISKREAAHYELIDLAPCEALEAVQSQGARVAIVDVRRARHLRCPALERSRRLAEDEHVVVFDLQLGPVGYRGRRAPPL